DENDRVWIAGTDVTPLIRETRIDRMVPVVARHPGVREVMRERQRQLGSEGNVVMEGRDIGTVVFPDADVKIFLDASLDERARRRYRELQARGVNADLDAVRRAEEERDRRDRTRAHSPLQRAPGAIGIDTTQMPADEVIERIVQLALRAKDE
ncbi:MAG TPA: (d)CMP kinase, partial [bacterium]|nr:(d)CMP kinase [bacterium]